MSSDLNLQIQAAGLRRLLEEVGDDPLLTSQIRELLEDAERELANALRPSDLFRPDLSLARAAIFLSVEEVIGTEGIKPQLAGEALIQYEKMFVAQAMDDERVARREQGWQRRRRGTSKPSLLFTGTLHGSFGLEFTPRPTGELQTEIDARIEVHAKSLRNIAETTIRVVESQPSEFDEAVKNVRREVLAPLKKFLGALARHGAEIRFAFPDQSSRPLGTAMIKAASERLEKEVVDEPVTLNGTVRGVTLETFAFDFRTDDGNVISGTVSPDLGEDDLDRIHKLTNRHCEARFDKITVSPFAGFPSTTYILLDANPIGDNPVAVLPT